MSLLHSLSLGILALKRQQPVRTHRHGPLLWLHSHSLNNVLACICCLWILHTDHDWVGPLVSSQWVIGKLQSYIFNCGSSERVQVLTSHNDIKPPCITLKGEVLLRHRIDCSLYAGLGFICCILIDCLVVLIRYQLIYRTYFSWVNVFTEASMTMSEVAERYRRSLLICRKGWTVSAYLRLDVLMNMKQDTMGGIFLTCDVR